MFDLLYKRSTTRRRHQSGPLAQDRLAYLKYLADGGMRHASLLRVAPYLLVIARHLHLAKRGDGAIGVDEIERKAALWARRRSAPNHRPGHDSRANFRWHAIDWLRFLGRLKPPLAPADPHAVLMADFADYLRRDRGFSVELIRMRVWSVRRFLDRLGISADSAHELTITRIDETLQTMIKECRWARRTVQTQAEHLRGFLRYAEMHGWPQGLAQAIQSPRVSVKRRCPAARVGMTFDA